MDDNLFKMLTLYRVRNNEIKEVKRGVVLEQSVTLFVNGRKWLAFMCLPIDLDSLALGFLFNEGIIDSSSNIRIVEIHPSTQMVEVWLDKEIEKPEFWTMTSGCGRGSTTKPEVGLKTPPRDDYAISGEQIISLGKRLFNEQSLYQEVGGVHASALSNGKDLVFVCEDIGRHNTFDKIAGKILLDEIDIPHPIILTSGRVSSEMLQKASRLNASIVISRTSPTSNSIKMAKDCGITLIGYARGQQFYIYSHPQRLQGFNQGNKTI